MKNFILGLIVAVSIPAFAQVNKARQQAKPVDICEKESKKAFNDFFAVYVTDYLKDRVASLEPGDVIDPDDIPGGVEKADSDEEGTYSYSWGQNQECLCGASVKTQKSADEKSCKAEVDSKSVGCDCG